MISRDAVVLGSDMLEEARAYLRLEYEEEDASLGTVLLGAIGYAEAYLGQMLLRRNAREVLPASMRWQRLSVLPVSLVNSVTGIPAEGMPFALSSEAYKIEIDAHGEVWLRVTQPGSAGRVEVACMAGMAQTWAELPEAIRLGVLRLAAHLHLHRDNPDDPGPTEGVAALLRPWRRRRLA
ncbi:hypothetical protein DXH95_01130 [Sphingorhabdus pulchriflava]|uniref:PhiE125 gp8 family phage protein n=2 Tax=Sphingorhabdus pulchriflava TaxID=2292257 RepID=A0A371BJP1_9SPHN|nr:hypothetical protein DXH95_01130 [Sphingorhabdus pulchriflava]